MKIARSLTIARSFWQGAVLLLTLFALLIPVLAWGQPAPVNRVTAIVIPTTGDPATVGAALCGVAPTQVPCQRTTGINATMGCNNPVSPPLVNAINPVNVAVDDPFNGATRECRFLLPLAIPDGQYRVVAVFGSDSCLTPPSTTPLPCEGGRSLPAGPFTVALTPRRPPVPTGARLIP